MTAEDLFAALVTEAATDPYVVGLFLTGSRGKGFENAYSDYDVTLVVQDKGVQEDGLETTRAAYQRFAEHPGLEVFVQTLSDLRETAAFGGPMSWARYGYAHVRALIDKTGDVQPLVSAKGVIPDAVRDTFLRSVLDAYLNSHYRSLKCHRNGNLLGAKLEAVAGLPALLDTLFGLEGRHAPYLGYLERELRTYPLKRLPLSADALLQLLAEVAGIAGVPAQQQLFLIAEGLCLAAGLGEVYDAWGDSYHWMKQYRPET